MEKVRIAPHKAHAELACKAFALGKHVLCDKPAGATIKEANSMTRAAEAANKRYGMMFHQHKYPKYLKIKELLTDGTLGGAHGNCRNKGKASVRR